MVERFDGGSVARRGAQAISTARLLLRPPAYDDAVPLHQALSDPLTCRFLPHRPTRSVHETRDLLAGALSGRGSGLHTYAIAPRASSAAIGLVQLGPDGEVGAVMARGHWGRGLMTEALGAMLVALGAERAWGICDAENEGMARVLVRNGLVPDARLPAYRVHPQISDRPRDCVRFRSAGGPGNEGEEAADHASPTRRAHP